MSYYVRFNFIENVEVNDVLPTISKFKKFFNDNAEQIVKKRFDKRPSVYDEWGYEYFSEFIKNTKLKNLNKAWLRQLFGVTFIYYPALKLLAFYTEADDEFDCRYIEFQNSCDQDYPLDYYTGISFAEKMYQEVFNGDKCKSKDWFDYICDRSFDDDDELDYIKRNFVYDNIEKLLDIEKLLYHPSEDFDDENHYLIDVNKVGEIRLVELNKYLNKLIKKEYEKLKI